VSDLINYNTVQVSLPNSEKEAVMTKKLLFLIFSTKLIDNSVQ